MRGTVFIVDDVPSDQDIIQESLAKEGFFVQGFSRGGDALRSFDLEEPDAIISDIFMPDLDGIEMIRMLRRKGYKGLIIAVSNGGVFNNLDAIKHAVIVGADFGVRKPVDSKKIGSLISAELEKSACK